MKKSLSLILALIMLLSAVPFTAYADDATDYYKDQYFQGLADPLYTKTTENYDGYKFTVGTKATWDCKLYTLTAKVTKVSGSIATFILTFNTKIPYKYLLSGATYGYEVKAFANTQIGSYSFYPSDSQSSMAFTVDTSKVDSIGSSVAGGMQFVKFEVSKYERNNYLLYGENPYYNDIATFASKSKRRDIQGTMEQWIDDEWALGYYVTPDYHIYKNNYRITKSSITLGTYAFDSVLQYRKKGASKYTDKNIAQHKKMAISGLKAGTTYQLWPLCKIWFESPEPKVEDGISPQKGYTLDQAASPFYLTTSLTSKPPVKSVKISNIKYGKKTIPAHWEDHANSASVWIKEQKLNTANYKITVKVKKAPKKAKGLVMTIGGSSYYAKGRKKTYTFKVMYQDKKSVKGKKLTARFAWSSNTVAGSPLGIGPAKAKSYKIKAGTYK